MLRITSSNRSSSLASKLPMFVVLGAVFAAGCGGPLVGDVDAQMNDATVSSDANNGGDAGSTRDFALTDAAGSAPSVVSTSPLSAAAGVLVSATISATFSEAMLPASLTQATFLVMQGNTQVTGVVAYVGTVATFTPSNPLSPGLSYAATVTAGVKSLAGTPMAADYSWSFNTSPVLPLGPPPVLLGTSGNYVVLAKSAISNTPTSMITGDIGLSPAAASFVTGFSLTRAGAYATSAQVVGKIYAADNDAPTPVNLTTSIGDMLTAYTDAAGRVKPDYLDLGGGAIGGLTLKPGLYKWSSAVTIPTDVTIAGGPNDVWIFQITKDLTLSSAKRMTLIGGARARNIVWQVAGAVSIGATAHVEGVVLCQTAISVGTGATVTGRLLAQTAVNLAGNAITGPAQ